MVVFVREFLMLNKMILIFALESFFTNAEFRAIFYELQFT